MDKDDKEVLVDVQCKISRSGISVKKFKIRMNRQLEEIREIFAMIFEIDAFLATFRFYYEKQPISCLADIRSPKIEGHIDLEVEFTGGWSKITKEFWFF